ncbi:hypothetical protein APA386B_2517 [Acetobacter pasteurianus 386B]|nr:hypothetical protein APA386B_2517 [Acetobacter pasteurianus 386B]
MQEFFRNCSTLHHALPLCRRVRAAQHILVS